MREKDSRQGEIDSTLAAIPETERLPFLWWELAQDKTAMAGRMLISSLEVMNNLYDDQLQAANLQHLGEIESYQHEADFLQRSYDLAYRKAFLESEIEEMEINRDRSLEQELIDIDVAYAMEHRHDSQEVAADLSWIYVFCVHTYLPTYLRPPIRGYK